MTNTPTETATETATLTSTETATETPTCGCTGSCTYTATETPTSTTTPSVVNARVYPNVVKNFQAGASYVTIDKVPSDGSVQIYTLGWDKVFSFSSSDIVNNSCQWYFCDTGHNYVVSGVYFCVIQSEGNRSVRRIVLIR